MATFIRLRLVTSSEAGFPMGQSGCHTMRAMVGIQSYHSVCFEFTTGKLPTEIVLHCDDADLQALRLFMQVNVT